MTELARSPFSTARRGTAATSVSEDVVTVVVGYIPHRGGRGALDLALQLAHVRGEAMAVVTVVPRQWTTPSLAKVDAE